MTSKKTRIIIGLALALLVIGVLSYTALQVSAPPQNNNSPETEETTPEVPKEEARDPLEFNKKQYSLDDPSSIWIVANKQRGLSANFIPANLVEAGGSQRLQSEAATALQQLISGAGTDKVSLRAISGYRSYAAQQNVYSAYVQKDGAAKADTYSARPGHSEHQTGLAMDVGNGSGQCDLEICFSSTAGGKWVAANAYKYGFVIRYPENKTNITGYSYEPWHLRYVGVDLATKLRSGQTMEEFFGLPAAPGY